MKGIVRENRYKIPVIGLLKRAVRENRYKILLIALLAGCALKEVTDVTVTVLEMVLIEETADEELQVSEAAYLAVNAQVRNHAGRAIDRLTFEVTAGEITPDEAAEDEELQVSAGITVRIEASMMPINNGSHRTITQRVPLDESFTRKQAEEFLALAETHPVRVRVRSLRYA